MATYIAFGALICVMFVTIAMIIGIGRKILKAVSEEPAPTPQHNGSSLAPIPPSARAGDGTPDPYLRDCYFNIGLIGQPEPYVRGEPQPTPQAHLGFTFLCAEADRPGNIALSYDIGMLELKDVVSSVGGSTLFSQRVAEGLLRITVQMLLDKNVAEDIVEKLNLYSKIAIVVNYTISLKSASITRTAQSNIRWKSSVAEEDDVSTYLSQYRS